MYVYVCILYVYNINIYILNMINMCVCGTWAAADDDELDDAINMRMMIQLLYGVMRACVKSRFLSV